MTDRPWPRCTSCGSRMPYGAPGTPVRPEDLASPPIDFVRILESHIVTLRTAGRQPIAIRINEVEAGRCGLGDAIEVLGRPVLRDNSLPLGRARLTLEDGGLYEFTLPVYFTEDR